MATLIQESNNFKWIAMNRKITTRHGQHYHEEGIGTVTILLAFATVAIIFYSIYSAI
jgi:hypothetical protein